VALGFRPHTGWSTVVAVGRERGAVRVLHRAQVKFAPAELPAQVFHAAREVGLAAAAELVGRVAVAAGALAEAGLGEVVAQLREQGRHPVAAGVPVGGSAIPAKLTRVLASHALLHAAEGDLYCQALADAADRHGLAVTLVPARDLAALAARELGVDDAALRARLAELGRELGPPWRRDEKDATLAAVLALAAAPAARPARSARAGRRPSARGEQEVGP
jgi:hypothetical protein